MSVATTEVTGRTTKIPGLLFFDVTYVGDERGYFQEKYQKAKLVAAGMPEAFTVVQNSLSYNKVAGVTRGFHAEPWDKYISVVTGRVFCAYLDLRKGETFGTVVTTELDSQTAVFLPQGVANSFQTLEPDTYYLYSVNKHWSSGDYDSYSAVNVADPDLNVQWAIPLEKAVISDRDKSHPFLKTVKPLEI